jgi:sn1-specific diacylglycerol lipase
MVVGIASPVVDHALFGGSGVSSLVIGGAIATAITLAEQLTLAPLNFGEYITSGSLLAAHSSINVLSVIFAGSSEASFSLASFITLVKREWNDPEFATNLPDRKFGLTEVARAIVAWVALQGVTQEWQEQIWLKSLKEIKVENHLPETLRRQRVGSRVRVTSDVIFPGNRGQVISADIGETPAVHIRATSSTSHSKGPAEASSSAATLKRPRADFPKPKDPAEMKATLRRLSKIVLAGYGGATLWFFGVGPEFTSPSLGPSAPSSNKKSEETKLEHAIDASEAEAFGDISNPSTAYPPTPSPDRQTPPYSWWDMLLGKHDQEIFEHYADMPVDQQTQQARLAQETWRRKKAQVKNEAVIGVEHQMPRFWVLTDHGRSQIVLVLRGTMSLNELAVDLTCEPMEFEPAATMEDDGASEQRASVLMPSHFPFPTASSFRRFPRLSTSSISSMCQPRYQVHSGMLKMARMMGEVGKPVHRAVQDALRNNPDYELVLCGHSLGAGVGAMLGLVSNTIIWKI